MSDMLKEAIDDYSQLFSAVSPSPNLLRAVPRSALRCSQLLELGLHSKLKTPNWLEFPNPHIAVGLQSAVQKTGFPSVRYDTVNDGHMQ